MTSPRSGDRSGSTTDVIILEPVKPPGDHANELVAEAEVEERVNCESCACHVIVLHSYDSRLSRLQTLCEADHMNWWCHL